jgi:hypothetical protein
MTKAERELFDEKLKGIIAMIEAQEDNRIIRDKEHLDIIKETRDLARITNGRVTKLEEREKTHYLSCPNIKTIENYEHRSRFWFWFTDKPIRLAIFFLIPIILIYLLSVENVFMLIKQVINML